jgi:uncharacterized protein Yka (UPF0111/DUF47 family)
MAANDYLKQASQLLRRASDERKREVNELQKHIQDLHKNVGSRVNDLNRQSVEVQSMAQNTGDDLNGSIDRGMLQQQTKNLQKEANNIKAEVSKQVNQIEAIIRDKQNDAQNLQQQSSDLDVRAGMTSFF